MASTDIPGSYVPGANSLPGTINGRSDDGLHRHNMFQDAGVCSKVVRELPMLAGFFKNVRNALRNVQEQSRSNASAIANLLQSQADMNNESNLLSYWMRQISPHLDKTNFELSQANDALASFDFGNGPIESDKPGVPTSITVLPFVEGGKALFFWDPPSYSGSSPITRYEYRVFQSIVAIPEVSGGTSAQVNAHNPAIFDVTPIVSITDIDAKRGTTDDPPGVIFKGQDMPDMFYGLDMYEMYGDDLRAVVISGPNVTSEDELSVRIRAVNTSGIGDTDLEGPWSAASRNCKTISTTDVAIKPLVTNVVTGLNFHLISWMHPSVKQSDGTRAPLAGVHGYNVNGISVSGTFPVYGSLGCGIQVAGTRTMVQVPRVVAGAPLISVTTPKVFVTACSDIAITELTNSKSDDYVQFTMHTVMPPPRIHVQIDGTTAHVIAIMLNFYDPGPITYEVTAHNITTQLPTDNVVASATSSTSGDSQSALASTSVNVHVVGLTLGHRYRFTATASIPNISAVSGVSETITTHTSVACASIGPFQL